jgi:hypothetical protein
MSALREAAQQALEALENSYPMETTTPREHEDAITALRAALAHQEQEQDAEAWVDKGSIAWLGEQRSLQRRKVRSRREWQSLSEEERDAAIRWAVDQEKMHFGRAVARAIEQVLKEKNT